MEHAQCSEQPVTPPPANLGRDEMNFALANVTEYILHRILKGSLISTIFNSQIRPPKRKGKSPRYFSVVDLSYHQLKPLSQHLPEVWLILPFYHSSRFFFFLEVVWIFIFYLFCLFTGMRKFENLIALEYLEAVRLQA